LPPKTVIAEKSKTLDSTKVEEGLKAEKDEDSKKTETNLKPDDIKDDETRIEKTKKEISPETAAKTSHAKR
jgi:hypothetical protein